MKHVKYLLMSLMLCFLAPNFIQAQATFVNLGTATTFGVLAGAGITNTGPTTVNGDVGSFPTTTQTGFGTMTINGVNHGGDAVTQQAKTDLITAYNDAAGRTGATPVGQLGGLTLTPGVYTDDNAPDSMNLTGTLTLDAQGDACAVFIFQSGSTLVTASASSVLLINGAQAANVFWQVGSSATLGTTTHFKGSILALSSITANTGATVEGRLLARNGAVTLNTNTITVPTLQPCQPTLTLSKISSPIPFIVGQTGTYTLVVGNSVAAIAPTNGSTITITDILPAGLTFVSGSGTGWSVNAVGQTVTATTNAVIAPGGLAPELVITVAVGPAAFPSVTNTATASGGGTPNSVMASDITPVIPAVTTQPILSLEKTHTPEFFTVGQQGTFSLIVGNFGAVPTAGLVTVIDSLPDGFTFVSGSGRGWTITAAGQTVTATTSTPILADSLAPPITLLVSVSEAAFPSAINVASVTGGLAVNTASAIDVVTLTEAPSLAPPRDFRGTVVKNTFASQTDLIHKLKWKRSKSSQVAFYILYRNGHEIATIQAACKCLHHKVHNRGKCPCRKVVYTLVAAGANGERSAPVAITLP